MTISESQRADVIFGMWNEGGDKHFVLQVSVSASAKTKTYNINVPGVKVAIWMSSTLVDLFGVDPNYKIMVSLMEEDPTYGLHLSQNEQWLTYVETERSSATK